MWSRRLAALLALIIIFGVVIPHSVSGVDPVQDTNQVAKAEQLDGSNFIQESTDENSTTRHKNPEDIEGSANTTRLQLWLSGYLEDRLAESALQLQSGKYQQAGKLLGNEYDIRLQQYVEISGSTSNRADGELGSQFRKARQTQRKLVSAVQEYNDTYDQYQRARDRGNETEARKVARDLNKIDSQVQRHSETVIRDYSRLGNQTNRTLDESKSAITNVSKSISTQQNKIKSEVFVGTDIRIFNNDQQISYNDPLNGRGRLVSNEGEPIGNRNVTLKIFQHLKTVSTDAEGLFNFQYRPRVIPINRSYVDVQYLPDNRSRYDGSETGVNVSIRQVAANLSVAVAPKQAAYRDRVKINTSVLIQGTQVANIPINVTIGEILLEGNSVTIDRPGTLQFDMLPEVAAGVRTITVEAGNSSTAVTATNSTTSIVVAGSGTNLTLVQDNFSSTGVSFSGRLLTDDSINVSNQTIMITAGQEINKTVQTGPDGRYSLTIDREQLSAVRSETVTVFARYNGSGRNLDSAVASIDIVGGSAGGSERTLLGRLGQFISWDNYIPISISLFGTLLLILVAVRHKLQSTIDFDGTDQNAGKNPPKKVSVQQEDMSESINKNKLRLDMSPGRRLLDNEDKEAAVQYTYGHIRSQVADSIDAGRSDTHWEFYNSYRDSDINLMEIETLQSLIEAYEQVVFLEHPNIDIDVAELLESIEKEWHRENGVSGGQKSPPK